jgi:uncharacterized protein (DUF1810 family)
MPEPSLDRFLQAQERDYDVAMAERRSGRKRTHWILYVLPQLEGLGRSRMALAYGLAGQAEAVAYFNHPILGARLVASVNAILAHAGRDITGILGEVDAVKFRSCLTLFAGVASHEACFEAALDAFYGGVPDPKTLELLGSGADEA